MKFEQSQCLHVSLSLILGDCLHSSAGTIYSLYYKDGWTFFFEGSGSLMDVCQHLTRPS